MWLIPNKRRWTRWGLLSKLTYVGFWLTVVGLAIALFSVWANESPTIVVSDDYRDVLAREFGLGYCLLAFDGTRWTYEVQSTHFKDIDWSPSRLTRQEKGEITFQTPTIELPNGIRFSSNPVTIPRTPGYRACPLGMMNIDLCVGYLREQAGADQIVLGLRTRLTDRD